MKVILPICCFLFFGGHIAAQSNDFLLLKKNGKTVRRLFAGQSMLVAIDSAGPYQCMIRDVYRDSLRLMSYNLMNTGTSYGGSYVDTVSRYYFTVHYKNITAFYNNRNKKFNFTGSGGTLMAAGILGLLAMGVNAAYLKQPLFTGGTPWFAAGSAALVGLGYLLFKSSSKPIEVGKKYQLVYIRVNS